MKNYFPKDFLLGSAAAAYHNEGAFDQDGKGAQVADVLPNSPNDPRTEKPEEGNLKHLGVDFYNRYKEDISLFGELGIKAYRTSISWARIFPKGIEDVPNEKGLKHYDDMFDELIKHGIEPVITITHTGETPLYLADNYGGFLNKEVIDFYLKYVDTIVKRYKDKVKHWITFNEINIADRQPFFHLGVDTRKIKYDDQAKEQLNYNMFLANARAIKIIKEIDPMAKVACSTALGPSYPNSMNPLDNLKAYFDNRNGLFHTDVHVFGQYPKWKIKQLESNGIKLDTNEDELKDIRENTVDYLAFSYYVSGISKFNENEFDSTYSNQISELKNPELEYTEWDWPVDHVGLRILCNVLWDRYDRPLFICENGFAKIEELEEDEDGTLTVNDDYRIRVLRNHLLELNKALADGVDVIGYTNWAVEDFVSGTTGTMRKRWGFIYIDRNDDGSGSLNRYKKKSFYWYKKLNETGLDYLFLDDYFSE